MGKTGKTFESGEGSMSKLFAGETAVKVTEEAIQIMGGYGYVRENPVERWHRDSKIYTSYGYVRENPVERWHRDSKIYTIFEGTARSSAW